MHLMPQMANNVACRSTVNQLGESARRTFWLILIYQPCWNSHCFPPRRLQQPCLRSFVITSNPRLQREPPTTCHKISVDKVIQLSSKLDFKKVHLNAGKKLSNKCTQLWVRDATQQLFVESATEMEKFHQSTNPPQYHQPARSLPQKLETWALRSQRSLPGAVSPFYGAVSCLLHRV